MVLRPLQQKFTSTQNAFLLCGCCQSAGLRIPRSACEPEPRSTPRHSPGRAACGRDELLLVPHAPRWVCDLGALESFLSIASPTTEMWGGRGKPEGRLANKGRSEAHRALPFVPRTHDEGGEVPQLLCDAVCFPLLEASAFKAERHGRDAPTNRSQPGRRAPGASIMPVGRWWRQPLEGAE